MADYAILIDDFDDATRREAVRIAREEFASRIPLEVSGGVVGTGADGAGVAVEVTATIFGGADGGVVAAAPPCDQQPPQDPPALPPPPCTHMTSR